MLDAVLGNEVVERRSGRDADGERIHRLHRPIGQEDDAGLGSQLEDVAGAIVDYLFRVQPRFLDICKGELRDLVDELLLSRQRSTCTL